MFCSDRQLLNIIVLIVVIIFPYVLVLVSVLSFSFGCADSFKTSFLPQCKGNYRTVCWLSFFLDSSSPSCQQQSPSLPSNAGRHTELHLLTLTYIHKPSQISTPGRDHCRIQDHCIHTPRLLHEEGYLTRGSSGILLTTLTPERLPLQKL